MTTQRPVRNSGESAITEARITDSELMTESVMANPREMLFLVQNNTEFKEAEFKFEGSRGWHWNDHDFSENNAQLHFCACLLTTVSPHVREGCRRTGRTDLGGASSKSLVVWLVRPNESSSPLLPGSSS